ncbi:MAG: hypothetical protein RL723_554 [Actinomycetota bacterium]|jgi:energy-coupling factor transport system permease protein
MSKIINAKWHLGFHPASWWIFGIAMASAAALSRDLIILGSLCFISIVILALKKERTQAASPTLKFYLLVSVAVIISRVIFRIVFNLSDPRQDEIALFLPKVEINLGFGDPVELLGDISSNSLSAAFLDGIRLAAIILGIGISVTFANPRKLLRSTPAVLYEIATSVAIAINLAPQMIKSTQRIRAAQKLRGRSKRIGLLVGTLIPVLEDALDKSQLLAASMSSRGFGRQSNSSKRVLTGVLSLLAVLFFSIGTYLGTTQGVSNFYLSTVGAGFALASLWLASTNSKRTNLITNSFEPRDAILLLPSIAIAVFSISSQVT